MKRTTLHIAALATLPLLFGRCDNTDYSERPPFDNSVYIDAAAYTDTQAVTFKRTVTDLARTFSATLAWPAKEQVEVTLRVDPTLVARYNARYGTSYTPLDPAYYTLSAQKAVIAAGAAASEPVTVNFADLTALELDVTHLLPVTITDASMEVMQGSRTLYYVVRRSSAITTAANIRDNLLTVPNFQTPAGAATVNGLSAITYEAIINVHEFAYPAGSYITTVMGVEQHLLMRIGDSGFPLRQIQIDGVGGKFPKEDNAKLLNANTWYHLAMVWNVVDQWLGIYVNGVLQSSGKYGANEATFDLIKPTAVRPFYIGHSFEDHKRQLDGEVSEVRVWSVARTAQQIWDNMYVIADPENEPGLEAYWKFDDEDKERGDDVIRDRSGNGNDAVADKPLAWPDGIEIPQLNR